MIVIIGQCCLGSTESVGQHDPAIHILIQLHAPMPKANKITTDPQIDAINLGLEEWTFADRVFAVVDAMTLFKIGNTVIF